MLKVSAIKTTDHLKSLYPAPSEIPDEFRVDATAYESLYLIDGKLQKWEGPFNDVISPVAIRNGERVSRPVIGKAPSMDEKTVLSALDAAVKAWDNGRGKWPTMSVENRILTVENFVAKMLKVRSEVVKLLMWEIGKSLEDSEKEFDRTIDYIRKTIDALKDSDRNHSRFILDSGVIALVRRSPLGVCLSMGPFNYPLNETYTTLIPALIMGNTVVVKPPKFGVLCHQPILSAFAESFPAGVVNFIYGHGSQIIEPIMKTGKIDVLAFIGSSRVADILKLQHPRPHRMRGVLSLDAKNPALIMKDADLELTVKEVLTGTLGFNGQRCTALKILFVHESIADQFVEKLTAAISSLTVGMPWEKGVKLTPLPESNKITAMKELVDDAVSKGAKISAENGGVALESFFVPSVVYPVTSSALLYTKEQFGPVIPVCTYKDESELLDFVPESNYGQQVSLFGQDTQKISMLIDQLANLVCRINLNAQSQRGPDTLPFAGRKDSAEATLSISDALRCFSIRSLVAAQATPESRKMIQKIVVEGDSQFLNTNFIL